MQSYQVTIEGTSPLLQFNSQDKENEKSMENQPPAEKAEKHCYRNPVSQKIYAPSRWIKGCIRDYLVNVAASKTKQKTERECSSFIAVEPPECDFDQQKYEINISTVLVKKNGKIVNMTECVRPLFRHPWKINFIIHFDLGKNKEEYRKIIDNAGRFQGIGSNTKNGYGRFKVIDFKEIK